MLGAIRWGELRTIRLAKILPRPNGFIRGLFHSADRVQRIDIAVLSVLPTVFTGSIDTATDLI
jgi:hypothetical protein